jgi:Ran GTPase-activating protein (RanGAP) involved in mRNA processing and transport
LNLKNFVNLTKFDIGWNFVGKEGIKLFSEKMEILKNLNHIILSRTEMGDEGFIKFCENMNKLKKLEVLYFWNNDITNVGGKIFKEKLNEMNDVKFIDLSVNKMSENVKQDIRDLCDIKHISYDI